MNDSQIIVAVAVLILDTGITITADFLCILRRHSQDAGEGSHTIGMVPALSIEQHHGSLFRDQLVEIH